MYNYKPGEESHYRSSVLECSQPTEEALRQLETLKLEVRTNVNIDTTAKLGDWYWQHGACAAARFWFRLWAICLGIHDGAHLHYRDPKYDERDPFPMISCMGVSSTPDEHGDDEVVYHYG